MTPKTVLDVALVPPPAGDGAAWPIDLLRSHLEDAGHAVVVGPADAPDRRADVVHCFGLEAARRIARSRPDLPLVVTPSCEEAAGTASDEVDDELAATASAVVRSSRDQEHVHRLGIPWSRTWVLPGAVDVVTYSRVGPMANRTGRTRLVSEMHGPDDGLEDVLAAIARLDDVELVVVAGAAGLADRASEVRAAAAAYGVSARLLVVEPESEGERAWWLRSAHLAVAVPHAPYMGDFATQAMACGNAVVVTPVDGLADLVVHGVTGLTVPVGEPLSLARAIGSLVADDFTVESQGIAAADRALSRFAWTRVVTELVGIYRRVAGEHAAVIDLSDEAAMLAAADVDGDVVGGA